MGTKLETFLADQGLDDNRLMHFGVKGQRWGFRRSDASLARAAQERVDAPDAVRAHETLAAIRAKGSLSAASDADLNHLVNRMNLEKRYADVDPSAFEKGHQAIQKTLKVGSTLNDVIKFTNSPAGHLLAAKLGFRTKSFGRHITPVAQLLTTTGKKKKK